MAINLFGNINIDNNTYNANLSDGNVSINSAQNSDSSKLIATLQSLLPGQTIEGQLVSQEGKSLQLLLQNNVLLNTNLDSQTQLSAGKNISFEIKSNNNGQLVLRPLLTNLNNNPTAIKALENASVKVSEETLKMVDSLMKEGMPINKDMLQAVNREMNLFPSADINDIVMLHKLEMPVNEANIEQMHQYNNNNQWMMGNISDVANDMTEMLMHAADNPEEYMQIVDKLESMFGEKANSIAGDGKNAIPNGTQLGGNNNVFDMLRNMVGDKASLKDSSEAVHKAITDIFRNHFLMEPDKVADKEYVKNYYNKIMETSKELEQFLIQNQKADTPLAKDMSSIRNNVDFMNQINELYNYVQLPLKMAGSQAQGDLYVYSKKAGKNSKQADEPLTALLHLSMETLGNMDIFLKLDSGKLSTDFSLEKEEMIDFIEEHIDELNARLTGKGYNVTTKVGLLSGENKTVIDNIKQESPKITIVGKQSFDARA